MKGIVRNPVMVWLPAFIPVVNVCWLFYYKYTVYSELKAYLNDDSVNPVMDAIVYPIVTCGFYNFYMPFKIGGLLERAQRQAGLPDASNPGIVLLLLIFLCSSHMYKIQSELNRVWEA